MNKRGPSRESVHLKLKVALYESFLYSYLPQLTSLSLVTRINLLDAFCQAGLSRPGTQGTPFTVYQAIRKQRQHQLKKQLTLKPYSLSLLSPPSPAVTTALESLQAANQESNSCKLAHQPLGINEGIKYLARQQQAQPATERNLLLLDLLGVQASFRQEIRRLADKKTVIILPLPLAALWQLHQKPDKSPGFQIYRELKQALDASFPAEHAYWSPESTAADFATQLKEAFSMEGLFYSALEPAPVAEVPDMVLVGLTSDAFMMEKVLQALQGVRPASTPPAGAQLGLFQPAEKALPDVLERQGEEAILQLLKSEMDNQALYTKGLQAGYLPAQLQESLERLYKEDKLAALNEKGQPLSEVPKACISYTAYKAGKPSCSFKLKE